MKRKPKKQFKKKPCYFCLESIEYIDYKNTEVLEKFTSAHGKIHPSRLTGTCARHQRLLATAIKRARIVALLPFVAERIRK
ncbi:30S ribosomal protein S18 [Mycoplasma procyoni]|nr:30S ribosomal protein S18 [Mycoplasma procyoni]MBN3534657.1 30S ribosomal protein S18 [Mycoplasma procyoni]